MSKNEDPEIGATYLYDYGGSHPIAITVQEISREQPPAMMLDGEPYTPGEVVKVSSREMGLLTWHPNAFRRVA